MFGGQKGTLEIRVEASVPLGLGDVRNLFHQPDAGAIHQNVQPSAASNGGCHKTNDLVLAADVARHLRKPKRFKNRSVFLTRLVIADPDLRSLLSEQ
jgi:hypothetical protein